MTALRDNPVVKTKRPTAGLFASLGVFLLFLGLMVYAMQRDPNVLTSQLVGKPAPSFVAPLAQGGEQTSPFGNGRWVVMNFWTTSCIVCRIEAPELERFYRQTSANPESQPLFISVNLQESNEQILNYAKDFNLSYPIFADRTGKISLDYGVTGTPETFFIDKSGIVRHRVAGEVDGDTITRFIEWLEQNPGVTSEAALTGFAVVRGKRG